MRKQLGKLKNAAEARRYRRKLSIRAKLSGTSVRPRICAARTNKHLTVQVIDDATSKTLLCVQTFGKTAVKASNNVEGAKVVGGAVAEALKGIKVEAAVFDRAGYKYHGVIAALVESIRENGIQI